MDTPLDHCYILILSLCLFSHVHVWSIMSSVSASGLFLPVLFLLALALVLFSCVLRKRRQMEGSYQPSAEECKQAKNHGAERPGLALPLPKEERLIWSMLKPYHCLGWSGRPKQNFHYNLISIFMWSPHTCAVLTNKWRVMDGERLEWWWVFIWHFWERLWECFHIAMHC